MCWRLRGGERLRGGQGQPGADPQGIFGPFQQHVGHTEEQEEEEESGDRLESPQTLRVHLHRSSGLQKLLVTHS